MKKESCEAGKGGVQMKEFEKLAEKDLKENPKLYRDRVFQMITGRIQKGKGKKKRTDN